MVDSGGDSGVGDGDGMHGGCGGGSSCDAVVLVTMKLPLFSCFSSLYG